MNDIAGKDKVGLYELFVELFHADFKGRLSLGILGNHLLNCAGLHAAARGFGMSRINEINYTWVLSRLVIEMNRFPLKNERFYISTWVEDVYRLFTNRNYAVYDADRNVMGYVRSVWAMIDMDSRKPVDLISLYGDKLTSYICKDEPCPIEGPTRFRLKEQVEPECVCMPKYSDIDINGHFNSIKYIEHILDLFPVEFHDRHEVRRFGRRAVFLSPPVCRFRKRICGGGEEKRGGTSLPGFGEIRRRLMPQGNRDGDRLGHRS